MSVTKAPMEEAVTRYRITVDQYHRMSESGILPDDVRTALLDGEIVERNAIGSPHGGTVNRLNAVFAPLSGRAVLSVQNSVSLPPNHLLEPDFALLRARRDRYTRSHPGAEDVLLLVEVADSSRRKDRVRKGSIYARHGIREYWIVDIPGDLIEVRLRPEGDLWGETRLFHRGEEIGPAAFPDFRVAVDAILPPPEAQGD